MADNKQDLEGDRAKDAGNRGDQAGAQKAPGRDANDDLSTDNRQDAGQRPSREGNFDREDREIEQPGSKQRDQE